jgi:hypothetical protein
MGMFKVYRYRSILSQALCSYVLAFSSIIGMQSASASAATISGTVADSSTGAPLSNVTVQMVGSLDQDTTDDQGRFSFTGVPATLAHSRSIAARADFRLTGRSIKWHTATGVQIRIYGLSGKLLDTYSSKAAAGSHVLPPLKNGIFLLESLVDGIRHIDKVRASGNTLSLVSSPAAATPQSGHLAKATAAADTTTLDFSVSDYEFKQMRMQIHTADTNIAVKLLPQSQMSGRRNCIIGIWPNPYDSLFHALLGSLPDYQGGDPLYWPDYPTVSGKNFLYDSTIPWANIPGWNQYNNLDSAASGAYDGFYRSQLLDYYRSVANKFYAYRVQSEWQWYMRDKKPMPTPDKWLPAYRHVVTLIKSDPDLAHVKIVWDYPFQYLSQLGCQVGQEEQWYPGDDYVDIIGLDIYAQKLWAIDPNSSENTINWMVYGDNGNLYDMGSFANAHGKPMMFTEMGDNFGDGNYWTRMSNFIKANNVVGFEYFNWSITCLDSFPANQPAVKAAWGNTHYTGNFWKLLPVPQ